MSFRSRIAVLIAICVAGVVAVLAVLTYVFVRDESVGALDRSLNTAMAELQKERGRDNDGDAPGVLPTLNPATRPGGASFFTQVVAASGQLGLAPGQTGSLPVPPAVAQLASNGGAPVVYDAKLKDGHVRVRAESYGPGRAVLVAAPITELDRTLARLQVAALITGLSGAVVGGVVGLVVAGAAVRPVGRLTAAAEQVARTRDLSTQLPVRGRDELSRLTSTFNGMLAALRSSEDAQRRLVADASHELRTPLTSLRLNVELLAGRGSDLPVDERRAVLEDVLAQSRELSELMSSILELARGQEPTRVSEPFGIDEVVERALASARRDWPDVKFTAQLESWDVVGDPARLERAVVNLLGNAAKYGGAAKAVQVDLHAGVLTVTDSGPGIAVEERERVFERFHRSASVQDLPGSGLGLAIVAQAVTELGGSVRADDAPGGGALLTADLRQAPRPEQALRQL